MARYEIDFCTIKDDNGKLIGFSVVAQPQTEAEMFCASFPKGLMNRKADIFIEGDTIVFKHSEDDKCSFCVGSQDVEALNDLLNCEGDYQDKKLGLYRDGFMTPGFKITLVGMNYAGKKGKAIMPIWRHQ